MTNRETQIIAEKGKQELFIVREFDAPCDRVFHAFTDQGMLSKFFAPTGTTMHFNHFDYKTRGSYSWCHKDQKGNVLCTFEGVIHEVHAPERIVQTSEFMELPERGHVVMERMDFEALPDNRTKLTIHDVCLSVADRDAMVDSGMDRGLIDIFNQLDALLDKKAQQAVK
jgi:uncharacterized protein YndB with AHSA1/START domain